MKIPDVCISRLFIYLRVLRRLSKKKVATVSSEELAKDIHINPNKVRKDLSYFGQFGRRGIGYDVEQLIESIVEILGLNKNWNMAICGVGNLGSALFSYKGFRDQGFNIVAAFDNDPDKIGKSWDSVRVSSSKSIKKEVRQKNVEVAIITVPASEAQASVNEFVRAGVKTILNFAPTEVVVPEGVKLRNVDLSVEIVNLTHFLRNLVGLKNGL